MAYVSVPSPDDTGAHGLHELKTSADAGAAARHDHTADAGTHTGPDA